MAVTFVPAPVDRTQTNIEELSKLFATINAVKQQRRADQLNSQLMQMLSTGGDLGSALQLPPGPTRGVGGFLDPFNPLTPSRVGTSPIEKAISARVVERTLPSTYDEARAAYYRDKPVTSSELRAMLAAQKIAEGDFEGGINILNPPIARLPGEYGELPPDERPGVARRVLEKRIRGTKKPPLIPSRLKEYGDSMDGFLEDAKDIEVGGPNYTKENLLLGWDRFKIGSGYSDMEEHQKKQLWQKWNNKIRKRQWLQGKSKKWRKRLGLLEYDWDPTDPEVQAASELKSASADKDEKAFRKWYSGWAKKLKLNPDPDDPRHYYDYRAAYRAGAKPDQSGHWPSQFKTKGHPREAVGATNTRTGQPATLDEQVRFAAEQPQEAIGYWRELVIQRGGDQYDVEKLTRVIQSGDKKLIRTYLKKLRGE